MTRTAGLAALICAGQLGLLGSPGARADGNALGADLEKLCPAAMREHEQLLAAHPGAKPPHEVTRPALRTDLLQMVDEDQKARVLLIAAMHGGDDLPEDDPARTYTRQVDARDLHRLKSIVAQDGLPTVSMVGIDGVQAAFLLIAHAGTDVSFQESMLKVFAQRLQDGTVKGGQFALLTDKVLIEQGKPQRYGTQFDFSGGDWKPQPIEDERRVDQRRHALGMVSMANYRCELQAIYGQAAHE